MTTHPTTEQLKTLANPSNYKNHNTSNVWGESSRHAANRRAERALDWRIAANAILIAREVAALGHKVETNNRGALLTVDGFSAGWLISFKREETGINSYRLQYTGRIRCTVGDFGERKSWPEGKAGLNVKKIAAQVSEIIKGKQARQKREAAKEAARANSGTVIDQLATSWGIENKWGSLETFQGAPFQVKPSEFSHDKVNVKLEKALTAEQAEQLAALVNSWK